MLKPIWKPTIHLPVFVKRPKPLLTDNTNKLRRNICSTQHSLGRRLDPLNWQQEIHSLCHPPVLLSVVVILQPFLLGKVHVAAVATVFSVWSKNCCLLFAQATLKKEGRGGSCGLSNKIWSQFQFLCRAIIFVQLRCFFLPDRCHKQVRAARFHFPST